ncbi:HEAT repeat domain-containing protein [Gimesia sp.]|uniref:HEAT repeat domain-containing protein n=1 Tax=Gimesia sp. TaxID=2024833 RepID=UPI003A90F648
MRQSICSYQTVSGIEMLTARVCRQVLLAAGLLLCSSSLVLGQQPADPNAQNDALNVYKELITPDEAVNFRKTKLRDFDKVLRGGKLSSAEEKKLIAEGAKYHVYLMTLKQDPNKPENETDLNKLRANILRDISFSGKISGNFQARELYLEELTKRAQDLLDNHRLVRFSAVVLLSQLDLRDEDRSKKTERVAYTMAYVPLVKILNDKSQPTEVKIVAANGLARIGQTGNPTNQLRVKIAEEIIDELTQSVDEFSWYQRSLVNALGSLGISDNLARQPIVTDALLKVMNNAKRTWDVRSAAAENIGKLPLKANADIKLITYSIVDMTRKMIQAYNANPNAFFWKRCFWNVYLAFKPENPADNTGLTKMQVNQTVVNDAYKQVIKPISTVLQPNVAAKINAETINGMDDWLKKNLPKNFRVAPVQAKPQNQQVAEGR